MATTTHETSESGVLDIIKLAIAAGVLVGGLYCYYYFLEVSLPLRVLMCSEASRSVLASR